MTDELKTDDTVDTPDTKNTVELEQDKLDNLINQGYSKGAKKTEAKILEELGVGSLDDVKAILKAKAEAEEANKSEAQRVAEELEATKAELEQERQAKMQAQEFANIQKLASEHGVTDVDYLKYQIDQAKGQEGFEQSAFIDGLKEAKPFLFEQNAKPVKTDSTPNKHELDAATRIRGAKSMQDLYKLVN